MLTRLRPFGSFLCQHFLCLAKSCQPFIGHNSIKGSRLQKAPEPSVAIKRGYNLQGTEKASLVIRACAGGGAQFTALGLQSLSWGSPGCTLPPQMHTSSSTWETGGPGPFHVKAE